MPTKPGSWTPASGLELTGTSLRLLSQNLDTQEERTITENELWAYISTRLSEDGNTGLSAEGIRDALEGLVGDARLAVTGVKGALQLKVVATRAGLPVTGEAFTLYAVDNDNGKRSLLLFLGGSYVDYSGSDSNSGGGGSGGGGSVEYFLPEGNPAGVASEIIYSGPGAANAVTVTGSAGEITVTIPQAAEGAGASFVIPSEFAGRDADGAVTVHFQYRTDYPFNQGEVTLKHPKSIEVYDRAAESANGADVLRGGNNPQRRVLPWSQAGRVSVQVAGCPSTYTLAIAI